MTNKLKNSKNINKNKALKRSAKGWPPARRKAQAERLRRARIWEKSTGPKSRAGKKIVSQNAYKHGNRCREVKEFCRALRRQRQFVKLIDLCLKRRYRNNKTVLDNNMPTLLSLLYSPDLLPSDLIKQAVRQATPM